MAGRKPLPAELHQLEKGKLYGDVADRVKNTPKAKKEMRPRCPQRLNPSERKVWQQLAVILKNYNLFTIANALIMELLAYNWVEFLELKELVDLEGRTIKSINGFDIINPNLQLRNSAQARILKCQGELGLSSSALAKIGSLVVSAQRKKSEMEGLID